MGATVAARTAADGKAAAEAEAKAAEAKEVVTVVEVRVVVAATRVAAPVVWAARAALVEARSGSCCAGWWLRRPGH